MDRPVVSEAAERLYAALEPLNADDESQDWALLQFCEALSGVLQEQVRYLVSEDDDGTPGWGVLFNLTETPEEQLPYLAQFVGAAIPADHDYEDKLDLISTHNGFQRGTVAALESHIRCYLIGSKHVDLVERDGGAYQLLIRTFTDETPDEAKVMQAILQQKPAGLVLDYAAVDGTIYAVVEADFTDYADLLGSTDSYSDLLTV